MTTERKQRGNAPDAATVIRAVETGGSPGNVADFIPTAQTDETPRERILRVAGELGLTLESTFIPWSQSRNKGEKHPSLNWHVRLIKDGRTVLETDYSAGSGHAPSYKQMDCSLDYEKLVNWECEHGRQGRRIGESIGPIGKPISVDAPDVLASLVLDSDVIEHPNFESWAGDLGYDTDSRKAEAIYTACLGLAMNLRYAIGERGLARLRDACQDY